MSVALEYPLAALLLLFAILPLLGIARDETEYSDVSVIPADLLSAGMDWALRGAGSLAIVALALSVGGLHRPGEQKKGKMFISIKPSSRSKQETSRKLE